MSEEWGPWIEHDGKGCPCLGQVVHAVFKNGAELIGVAGSRTGASWTWALQNGVPLVRYRIRKPRGLTILEELLADLPAPVGPKVDA